MMRPALFGNLFGVLALFQSGRLVKDSEALMKSVKLLQVLGQHYNHLQEQPQKALVDILSQVPETMLQEILPKVLKPDLNSVFGSPEHLELFLLAQQKVPKKLEKLMGPVNLFSDENVPRLVTVLKTVANSVKKERKLPTMALDLLRLALQEDKFPWFWKEVVEQGLLKKQFWPASYLCFRLLGAALPLLSKEQLQLVMQGDLIRHYGEHMVTAKLPKQFKFAPEMNEYVGAFLEGCRDDPERQLALVVAFTSITNQGLPVVPTFWRVVQFLSPAALKGYVAWLRDMFLQPDLDSLVDFSTNNQKKTQDASFHGPERAVFRLRKWIILRLVSIVDNLHVEKEEALIEEVARSGPEMCLNPNFPFCFFHSFFETKKPTSQIPESEQHFSLPLDGRTREVVCSAFFSLLQTLSTQFRLAPEQTADGRPWTYHLVQFADSLLNHSRNVAPLTAFTTQQRQAWDRMLKTLKELDTLSSEAKATAFQHLLLLVGIHLFKSPAESCDLLGDIQTCIKKSLGEKTRRTRSKATNPQEPPWVEVLVEILLSLLAQPSHLMRQVARSVFGHVLDLIEVLVTKQPENPLVLELLEPLLLVIRRSMRSNSSAKQEQDLLHKTARIFTHHLCRSRHYCRTAGDRVETLYARLERLVQQASQQADSSVALYHFNASLYLLRVLRGSTVDKSTRKAQKKEKASKDASSQPQGLEAASCLDLSLVTPIYSSALSSFLTKRNSPLTVPMFLSLFSRHPMLCKNLLPIVVEHVTSHTRPRHQVLNPEESQDEDDNVVVTDDSEEQLLGDVEDKSSDGEDSKGNKGSESEEDSDEEDSDEEDRDGDVDQGFREQLMAVLQAGKALGGADNEDDEDDEELGDEAMMALDKSLASLFAEQKLRIQARKDEKNKLQKEKALRRDFQIRTLRTLGEAETKSGHQRELAALELLNTLFRNFHNERGSNWVRVGGVAPGSWGEAVPLGTTAAAALPACLQKLTMDLTAVLGVLQSRQPRLQQSLQQGEHSAGSSRLHDLYWQAMKFLGVQYVSGRAGAGKTLMLHAL
ncbi:hypothetical protein Celaphus_00000884 [Cervus elaphus hippelaphus]|uniref:MYBBP1A n=1 Tax=Cervus elaphus hippelaphus TaxID=46360 RepID=A0A212D9H2_CEREH|nr:hypothetical protein Celaphus_00000884 [Cervus elaphus hippelaphus]